MKEAIASYINELKKSLTDDSIEKKERGEQLLKRMKGSLECKHLQANDLWREMEKKIDFLIKRNFFITPKEDFTILDDGCGVAAFTYALASKGYKTFGIDPDMDSLSLGLKMFDRNMLRIVRGHGEELPFKDESFDLIISKSVLEHVSNKLLYIKEIYRSLKRPGIFFDIWIPNGWWYREIYGRDKCLSVRNL